MAIDWEVDAKAFERRFGAGGALAFAAAPGRVNLIGEHTDYHEGFVLPAAIGRHVRALGRTRSDCRVRVFSETFQSLVEFDLAGPMSLAGGWGRRAEGIVRQVLSGIPQKRGMEIWMDADLPSGGGLSSSAASMAALGMLAARLHGFELDRVPFAKALQAAEHEFAGVRCGLMDQLAVLLGRGGHALLIDCRSLEATPVPLREEWTVVIMDTGVRHDLASSEYNRRREECAGVLARIQEIRPEVRSLRDATHGDLDRVASRCEPVAVRRCRHVLQENERVLRAVVALGAGNGAVVRELFAASHRSLRDDYQVSCRELDRMVEIAADAPGCVAARMTGGGFGGSTVNLVEREKTEAFVAQVVGRYARSCGREGRAIVAAASDGASTGALPPVG